MQRFVPTGLMFPPAFLNALQVEVVSDLGPWYFTATAESLQLFHSGVSREQFPYRVLVPFAEMDGAVDEFFLAGNDRCLEWEVPLFDEEQKAALPRRRRWWRWS